MEVEHVQIPLGPVGPDDWLDLVGSIRRAEIRDLKSYYEQTED